MCIYVYIGSHRRRRRQQDHHQVPALTRLLAPPKMHQGQLKKGPMSVFLSATGRFNKPEAKSLGPAPGQYYKSAEWGTGIQRDTLYIHLIHIMHRETARLCLILYTVYVKYYTCHT